MTFNVAQFEKTKYEVRQDSVKLPALADFFEDSEKPFWFVRGLTHAEIAQADEAVNSTKNLEALVNAISGDAKEKAGAITELLGVTSEDVPRDTKKRIEHLVIASVDPVVTMDIAVKLADCFPIEFAQLTNKIMLLTGQGKVQAKVKQKPSGK